MMKKILIIGSCLVVVLALVIVGGIFVVKKVGFVGITGVPTYIANKVLPPPNIKNKSNEEQKEIVIRLMKEAQEAAYSYQMLKAFELEIRILRIGTPVVPVLLDIFRDKATEKITVIYAGEKIEGMIRSSAVRILGEIIKAKIVPLEKRLQEEENPFYQNYLKRFYKYANRIEIDIEKIVSEL